MALFGINTRAQRLPSGKDYGSQLVRANILREERRKRMAGRAARLSYEAETKRAAVDVDRITAEAKEADVAQQERLKRIGVEGGLAEQRLTNIGAMKREKLSTKAGLEEQRIATAPAALRAETERKAVARQAETDVPLARLGVHTAFQERGLPSPVAKYFEGEEAEVAKPSAFREAVEAEPLSKRAFELMMPGEPRAVEEEDIYGFGPRPLPKKAYKKRPSTSLYSRMFNLGG